LLALGRMGRTTVSLTPRERECLLWTAAGKSAWQTAQILGISYRTVYFHLANVRSKMGVVNVYHAVMKAIMEGIISP
jgi:DNA-binding CsgD family transcriptional regulator